MHTYPHPHTNTERTDARRRRRSPGARTLPAHTDTRDRPPRGGLGASLPLRVRASEISLKAFSLFPLRPRHLSLLFKGRGHFNWGFFFLSLSFRLGVGFYCVPVVWRKYWHIWLRGEKPQMRTYVGTLKKAPRVLPPYPPLLPPPIWRWRRTFVSDCQTLLGRSFKRSRIFSAWKKRPPRRTSGMDFIYLHRSPTANCVRDGMGRKTDVRASPYTDTTALDWWQ